MSARRTAILALTFLAAQLVAGCALTEEKEALPASRKVRVVTFPVSTLKFASVSCTQKFEQMELSGSLKNVSLSPLSNVRLRVEIFFGSELSSEKFDIPLNPPLLQPGQSGDFLLSGTVHHPISHVELHARWEFFFPPES
ncbi:MAG: hypothetical protein JSV16_04130 [Candidatus Hydrogenedentota bacterium]|nr:MAG: hypothetical protein JSV16_04130 [Candidatus Hydrogenedentota bacterium]